MQLHPKQDHTLLLVNRSKGRRIICRQARPLQLCKGGARARTMRAMHALPPGHPTRQRMPRAPRSRGTRLQRATRLRRAPRLPVRTPTLASALNAILIRRQHQRPPTAGT